MKTEITAYDIIPYLGERLKVMDSRNEIYELEGIKGDICFLKGLTYPCDISDIKPILRPMGDVIKPYKDDAGAMFIPAKDIWSIDADEEEQFDLYGKVPQYWKDCMTVGVRSLEYRDVLKLVELHFDVFGLINDGTAIDYNTISK